MADTPSYAALEAAAATRQLAIFGAWHPANDPDVPEGTQTMLLLGPGEPGFWAHVQTTPEFTDGTPDPLDRWSRRVIGQWACDLGDRTKALFPFGGPPWRPFIRWAQDSGRAHVSPVGLLVHDAAGLMISYRGALALRARIDLPPPPSNPCERCTHQPCRIACPISALAPTAYDVPLCKSFLDTSAGLDCHGRGCAVRRACPISKTYGRAEAQSAFHMNSFHRRP
ncbi:ferredoxin [Dinoroseobacter sp. S76]|uniref:ferredoxin n=1 Tax=Dinoroseobacter sp. S76 TaxID=3415124 RepID=UPI003C7B2C49